MILVISHAYSVLLGSRQLSESFGGSPERCQLPCRFRSRLRSRFRVVTKLEYTVAGSEGENRAVPGAAPSALWKGLAINGDSRSFDTIKHLLVNPS